MSNLTQESIRKINRELKKMESNFAQQKLINITEKAVAPMLQMAKTRVPVGKRQTMFKRKKYSPGRLRNSLHIRTKKFNGTTIADVKAKTPYAWLVEYGHKIIRVSKKTGKRTVIGFAKPNPYMRQSFDATSALQQRILETELTKLFFK